MEKINDEQLKRELPFDLYGRYAVIRDIINVNRKDNEAFRVLDVGGRGNLLKRFLPNDSVSYLDPLMESEDENFIKGDGCAMPLKDNSFDWVTSADVFEHIPKEKREVFLNENIRVAKKATILVAPFYSAEVVQAEANANENYKTLSRGKDHLWLVEHIENGLPDAVEFEKFLEMKKISFQKLYNNRLFLWQALINVSFLVSENFSVDIKEEFEDFNYFYNTEIFPYDNQEPSYRKIYFIKKDRNLKNIDTKTKAIDDVVFLNTIAKGFDLVNKINNLSKNSIQKKDQEITNLNHTIQQKDQEITNLNHTIQQKNQEIIFVKSSKFWKLRELNFKIKFVIFHPILFVQKYQDKIRRLRDDARRSFKREGFLNVSRRIINYIIYGKGTLKSGSNIFSDASYVGFDAKSGSEIERIASENFLKFGVVPYYLNLLDTFNLGEIKEKPSIAIHLHLFHVDMVEECIGYLLNVPLNFDLYVSVQRDVNTVEIVNIFKSKLKNINKISVENVPNRGRDIGPLIIQFGKRLSKYDIISHIHTKKSVHWDKFNGWFESIMSTLYGSISEVSQIIDLLMKKSGKVVYSEGNVNIILEKTGWSENYDLAEDLLKKYSDLRIQDFPFVEFSQGSMFWARTESVKDFLNLPLKYSDFPEEPIPVDGTLAHTLERLLLVFASKYEGRCYRIHKRDSINDFRYYEEQGDYSKTVKHNSIKILSYYLPQFHPTPENDKWHGEGFTEWHKVRKANPLFCGHYQQHIPHEDIGYYLLDSPDVLRKQLEMMKKAGVYGQIFYHYWFTGKLILEKPAKMLLENNDIEMPYCFRWANENWTKKWDGNEQEILLGQNYSEQDAVDFIKYLLPFFKDERYIKIDGRPVLHIYRPASIPNFKIYSNAWKKICFENGIKEPYVVATLTREVVSPLDYGMDAGAERVLTDWTKGNVLEIKNDLNQYVPINGSVLKYDDVANYYTTNNQSKKKPFTYFRSIVPTWDNTARYGQDAYLLHGSTTVRFQNWLKHLIKYSERTLEEDRRFVIVNAWNEWAEGAHLEPDTRFGYGYLNSVGRALSEIDFSEDVIESTHFREDISKELIVKFNFTPGVLEFLRSNKQARKKFIRCLVKSSVLSLCNVIVSSDEIIRYAKEEGFELKKSSEDENNHAFILLFGSVGCFNNDAISRMVSMGIRLKTSVVCANCIYDPKKEAVEVLSNSSINNFDVTPVRLYPNVENNYKNYRLCCKALYSNIASENLITEELPVVTTIIRFHGGADINLLDNALISLVSQSDCVVQPLIATQDLSSSQMEALVKTAEQYPWNEKYKPIIKNFFSDNKNSDLRSKMLNESLKSVTTKYVAFLDYDDILFSSAYKWLLSRIKKTGKAVAFGRVFVTKFNKQKMQILERKKIYVHGSDYEEFLANNHAPLHSFLIDMQKINTGDIEYFDDMKYLEDYYLTLQIFTEGNVDWESLKFNYYVGDYIHSDDGNNTLAVIGDDEKKDITKNAEYLLCENRISELRKKLKSKNR